MQEEHLICPYPGLRPFNEDESIFFKGREEHIEQIVRQLEEKKFLMLTGASGDGKSSLVYAGVIPHARAGFFKAKFNNWVVADFRPERNPLKNMAIALNVQLKVNDVDRVEKELSYGFSSLIDIYKASGFWVDQQSDSYLQLNADEQKKAKRKGANLLILVDQFEEFFTNPENYANGKASIESQAVINSLLETTRLALEQDLPIYIVCTMRSDYIGQCASFRGLPEYIGYSQFFVPRLKRKEIYQVIEEPAQLNGNKISKRLIEMLINEMSDGIDQLPVLQHALNQIWQKADRGQTEMDIIHFAKINGIPKNQLTNKDKTEFEAWFDKLPEFKKEFFKQSSLGDVLDAHANELFETANNLFGDKVSEQDAKLIVETAFKCLTKIDEARAVRNRMTLDEVTQIINKPHITNEIVAQVLYIFRVQGNTFLKPFIFDESSSKDLPGNSVLDITHESLIRNWKKLTDWAKEEYENLLTWQDFNKQLQRYVSSSKSSGYLLPIGPLTFFETWFNTAKPNKHWLARYDDSELSKEQKLVNAEKTLADAHQFIKRSARRLFVSRTVLKYGADTLIAVFGLILLVFSCTYFYFDFRIKQNEYVIEDITTKGLNLLQSDKVKNSVKAKFLINYERLHPGTTESVINSLHNDTLAYDLASSYFGLIQNYNEPVAKTHPMAHRLVSYMDSVLNAQVLGDDKKIAKNIKRLNNHITLCAYIKYYKNSEAANNILNNNLKYLKKYIDGVFENPEKANIDELNLGIGLLLTLSEMDSASISKIIDQFTPFKNESAGVFNTMYPKDQNIKVDNQNYLTHKGGYQILSYLYAAKGDYSSLSRCLDSLYKSNPDYNRIYNNGFNETVNFLFKYQRVPSPAFEDIINKHIKKFGLASSINTYYNELVNRQLLNTFYFYENPSSNAIRYNYINCFIPEEKKQILFNYNADLISSKFKNDEEKILGAALYHKNLGIYYQQAKKDTLKAWRYFKAAITLYGQLPAKFLESNFIFYDEKNESVKGIEKVKNSTVFLYPISSGNYSWSLFGNGYSYCDDNGCYEENSGYGTPFLDYLVKNNLFSLYRSTEDIKSLEKYLYRTIIGMKTDDESGDKIVYQNFHLLVDLIKDNKQYKDILDENFIQLVNLKEAVMKKDSVASLAAYKKMDLDKVLDISFQKRESPKDNVHKKLIRVLCVFLASNGINAKAFKVNKVIVEPWERRNSLIDAAYNLVENDNIGNAFIYIDSLLPDIKKKPKFGMKLFRVFGKIGGSVTYEVAGNIFKDIDDKLKPRGLNNFIWGIAQSGQYYKALTSIPNTVSRVNELGLYNEILHAEIDRLQKLRRNSKEIADWKKFDARAYGEFINENYDIEGEHFGRFSE